MNYGMIFHEDFSSITFFIYCKSTNIHNVIEHSRSQSKENNPRELFRPSEHVTKMPSFFASQIPRPFLRKKKVMKQEDDQERAQIEAHACQ